MEETSDNEIGVDVDMDGEFTWFKLLNFVE